MQTSLTTSRGFTLIELLLSLAAVAAIYFLTASGIFLTTHESRRALEREALEGFEIGERMDLASLETIVAKSRASGDSLLYKCLSQPCLKECAQIDDWRPVAWGRIQSNLVFDSHGVEGNIGSGFDTQRSWKRCPLLRNGETPVPPFFPDSCRGRARAYWRSGESGNIIFRIFVGVPSFKISKKIDYSIMLPRDPVTGSCQKASGNSCGTGRVFLTGADLKNGSFSCSHIRGLGL